MTQQAGPQFGEPDPNQRYLSPERVHPGKAGVDYDLWVPSAPPPVRKSRKGIWWTVGVAAVCVFLVVGGFASWLVWQRYEAAQAARKPTPTITQAPDPSSTGGGNATPTPTSEPTPYKPGWQVVKGTQESAAYDVPPDWQVRGDTITGYQTPENVTPSALVVGHSPSTYLPGACPEIDDPTSRGFVSFATTPKGPPDKVAPELAHKWADVAGISSTGEHSPVSAINTTEVTLRGNTPATKSVATMRPVEVGGCVAPQMQFTVVAFEAGGKTVAFVMAMDQETDDAAPQSIIDEIAKTPRPLT